ncbi:MAG: nicotinate (nicotinamide) nucleotide adenylyltransferase [Thermoleophilia bacterium]|nr:nicotinate (nicotinamide) nucleotide adenylyltransferase [Thermoleophilia bacterium]
MRIGLLGGTFNPPHHGHLICAEEARIQLDLDEVLLIPAGDPPHRDLDPEQDADPRQQLQMCRLAVAGQTALGVSSVEIDRPGPSFTVDTLEQLAKDEPDNELVLIIGADQAASFGNWREPERIAELARIAVAARVDYDIDDALAEVERATGLKPVSFDMPRIDISSSLIRDRVHRGRVISHVVPPRVAEYVAEQGLYR